MRVLTVDDSPSIRQMVKLVLSQAGFEVHEAVDGIDGLEKAKAKSVQQFRDISMLLTGRKEQKVEKKSALTPLLQRLKIKR